MRTIATVYGADDRSRELVRRAADGDAAAFVELVGLHTPAMARLAMAICRDQEAAQDVVQTAWTSAWRHLRDVRHPERVRSWLLTLSANEARRLKRRQRRRSEAEARASEPDFEDARQDTGEFADLSRALDRLSPEGRELLGLRYGVGLTSVEIATHLAMSPGAVRVRLMRILQQLRKDLDHG